MTRAQTLVSVRLFVIAGSIIATVVGTGAAIHFAGYELVFNVSPSVPRGLYLIRLGAMPSKKNDYVVFYPTAQFSAIIYGREWLPSTMPLLKLVGGLAGDVYCVEGGRFIVNGTDIGPVFANDSQDLPLPQIDGCRRVNHEEFLPVSTFIPRSFDGRYMGAVAMGNVVGSGGRIFTY